MSGSSKLTPEQSDWYLARYGVRYSSVQEAPLRPSRRVRRGRPRDNNDLRVLRAQNETARMLEKQSLQAKAV